jgi:hypothetical protein
MGGGPVNSRFRVNNPHVISETIQGEVIVIHLETGSYYSLRDAGAEIWNAVERGAAPDEIVDALAARYEGSREEMAESCRRLLAELEAEGLVAPTDSGGNGAATPVPSSEAASAERAPFKPPAVEKYTDMQDLILLDPVHEVDERGWPHAEADAARD